MKKYNFKKNEFSADRVNNSQIFLTSNRSERMNASMRKQGQPWMEVEIAKVNNAER